MLRLNARKGNWGFTLVESAIIVVILAILVALATPSLLGTLDRFRLSQAVVDVRGAFLETQRQAIRRSQPCLVTLSLDRKMITGDCLVTGDRTLPEHIQLVTNILDSTSNTIQIMFGILGTAEFRIAVTTPSAPPPNDPSGKIVLYMPERSTSSKKCVAISNTLGLARVGTYTGPLLAPEVIDHRNSEHSLVNPQITSQGVCTASE
jgi:type II secretory pathway pseudopilin PulG